MDFDNIDTNLAQTPDALKRMLENCRARKRIEKATPTLAITLVAKARYNIQVAESLEAEGYFDWAIVASYSAMFMAANAFTAKFQGATAKDHSCIIALILESLEGKKLAKPLEKVRKTMEKQVLSMEKIRRVRNLALYTVTEINPELTKKSVKIAGDFVEKIDELV